MRLNAKPKVKYASSDASCCCCSATGWPHSIVQALAMTTTTTRPSQTLFRSSPAAAVATATATAAFSSTQYNPISTSASVPRLKWHLPVSNIIIIGNGNGIERSLAFVLVHAVPCRVLRLCAVCLWLCLKCQVTMPDNGDDDATAIAVYWYWCNFVVVVVAGVACGWLLLLPLACLLACLAGLSLAARLPTLTSLSLSSSSSAASSSSAFRVLRWHETEQKPNHEQLAWLWDSAMVIPIPVHAKH